jgi:V8-like Glu-specific endopeptidase
MNIYKIMSGIKEKKLRNYPEIVSLEVTEKIINQMKENICKIYLKDGSKGTGFFCKIPYTNNKELKVLITNNHVINLEMEKIKISINNDSVIKEIELNNRIKYTNKEYDITIIEIREKDNIEKYLEIDENIMEKDNIIYKKNSIYILQYPGGKRLGVSYGILKGIYEDKEYNFNHLCSTEEGSSGSPIINLINNKVIGIQKESDNKNNYNMGLFINYAIDDFINNININNNINIIKE